MKTIPARYYFDENILGVEKKCIFEKEWLYVCLKRHIFNKRDWIVIELLGKSIIIYNTGSEIKAFKNVCPHRFNRIFTEKIGNSALICKYHHWAFNEAGCLISNKDNSDIYPSSIDNACLNTYLLEVLGDFVFINLSVTPQYSLIEQLGNEISEQLLGLSERMHERIFGHEVHHSCNWKFIIENVIENKHCLAIHRDTLVKAGFCKAPPEVQTGVVKNSYFIIPLSNESTEKKRSYIIHYLFGKKNVTTNYKHTYIYPNLVISDFEGINFNIGNIIPLTGSESIFNMEFYVAKPNNDNSEIYSEYKKNTIEFGKKVFEEDKLILENLQQGVKEIEHDGFQYISEKRIEWFIDSYYNSIQING